ncbi:hypothetical protein MNV49_000853 [Pseudohyphozyma bogoriensis]|nr:hypothetical protein MNV49_000853 [Pseudohyphozyma bogoriensis]
MTRFRNKSSVVVHLDQEMVFVHPCDPGVPGDALVSGVVVLSLVKAKRLKGLAVELVGLCDAYGGQLWPYETTTTLSKKLELSLDGEEYEAGEYRFSFSFMIPATTAPFQRSSHGRVRHYVKAHVGYSAALSTGLTSPATAVWISASPSGPGEPPEPLDLVMEHWAEDLGPILISVSSPHLTVSSLLFTKLHFVAPPTPLLITQINIYVQQFFDISYAQTPEIAHPLPRRFALLKVDVAANPSTSPTPPFRPPSRTPSSSITTSNSPPPLNSALPRSLGSPPRPIDIPLHEDSPLQLLEEGTDWKYSCVGRIPDDELVRPSTLKESDTKIRVSHKVQVEINNMTLDEMFDREGYALERAEASSRNARRVEDRTDSLGVAADRDLKSPLKQRDIFVHPTADPEVEGIDSFVTGVVVLSLPKRRRVRSLEVELAGVSDTFVFGPNLWRWETNGPLRDKIKLELDGEELVAGDHRCQRFLYDTFDNGSSPQFYHSYLFSFRIPSSTPSTLRSATGDPLVRYHVKSKAVFESSWNQTLRGEPVPVVVHSSPVGPGQLPPSLEYFADRETTDFGLTSFSLSSPHLALGSFAEARINFSAAPSSASITAINLSIVQTTEVHFKDDDVVHYLPNLRFPLTKVENPNLRFRTGIATCPLSSKASASAASSSPQLDLRASSKPASTPSHKPECPIESLFVSVADPIPLREVEAGEAWRYKATVRIPKGFGLHPTTLAGSASQSRISHRLQVEVVYRVGDVTKKINSDDSSDDDTSADEASSSASEQLHLPVERDVAPSLLDIGTSASASTTTPHFKSTMAVLRARQALQQGAFEALASAIASITSSLPASLDRLGLLIPILNRLARDIRQELRSEERGKEGRKGLSKVEAKSLVALQQTWTKGPEGGDRRKGKNRTLDWVEKIRAIVEKNPPPPFINTPHDAPVTALLSSVESLLQLSTHRLALVDLGLTSEYLEDWEPLRRAPEIVDWYLSFEKKGAEAVGGASNSSLLSVKSLDLSKNKLDTQDVTHPIAARPLKTFIIPIKLA